LSPPPITRADKTQPAHTPTALWLRAVRVPSGFGRLPRPRRPL